MFRLSPVVMNYAWGSHEAIANLTGRTEPSTEPEAELWMGAHERAPSTVTVDGRAWSLDRLLQQRPDLLGTDCGAAFGGRLPFLLKILAPQQPLSIQCHPDAGQALDAPAGTYTDAWPKPEAVVAVTEFEILAGVRPFSQMCELADELAVPELSVHVAQAAASDHPMRALLENLLSLPASHRTPLVRNVVRACSTRPVTVDGVGDVVARFAHLYPDDVGLVVALLMQHRVLAPGSYVFVPAGVLHAYVRGAAVEVLANSDNVVRAGLTGKPINIDELLRIVDVDKQMEPADAVRRARVRSYPADAAHFRLHTVDGDEAAPPAPVPGDGRPRILLALHDAVTVSAGSGRMTLGGGQSCFVPAGAGRLSAKGAGSLFVATSGTC